MTESQVVWVGRDLQSSVQLLCSSRTTRATFPGRLSVSLVNFQRWRASGRWFSTALSWWSLRSIWTLLSDLGFGFWMSCMEPGVGLMTPFCDSVSQSCIKYETDKIIRCPHYILHTTTACGCILVCVMSGLNYCSVIKVCLSVCVTRVSLATMILSVLEIKVSV